MSDLWPMLHCSKSAVISPYKEPDKETYVCSVCEDADAIDQQDNEVVCTRCGTIIDIPLDWSAEYRWYSNDGGGGGGDPSRCGFPVNPLMPESSLGTLILSGGRTAAMRRIKRYHMWNQMPYREHTLWRIFETLQIRASNAGIGGAIVDEAKELFAQLTASQICRGPAQRDSVLAACLWEALRRHDAPRLPKDIADIFAIPLKNVTKGIKQFQQVLAMRTNDMRTDTYTAPVCSAEAVQPADISTDAAAETALQRAALRKAQQQATLKRATSYEDFVTPFLSLLSIPRHHAAHMEAAVRHVCAKTEEYNIVPENTPPSLTASVIAFVADDAGITLDQTEIARVCGISAVTIQKCLKRMAPWKEKLLKQ